MYASRIRVPLFRYFAVVTPVLLGLLLVAEAFMGPPPPMKLTSHAPVLLKKQVAPTNTVQVLSIPHGIPVPASQLSQIEATAGNPPAESAKPVVNATQGNNNVAVLGKKTTTKKVAADQKKKPTKVVRVQERRDRFAGFFQEPRPYGAVW